MFTRRAVGVCGVFDVAIFGIAIVAVDVGQVQDAVFLARTVFARVRIDGVLLLGCAADYAIQMLWNPSDR